MKIYLLALLMTGVVPLTYCQTGNFQMQLINHKRDQMIEIGVSLDTRRSCIEVTQGEGMSRVRTIADTATGTVTFLVSKEGTPNTGMVRPLGSVLAKADEKMVPVNLVETEHMKIIGDDTCRMVVAERWDIKTILWVTPDSSFRYDDILSFIGQPSSPAMGYIYNLKKTGRLNGFPLEVTAIPTAQPADSTTVIFTKFVTGKADEKMFSTEGYDLHDMRK